uniref:Pyrin domain-containing protein n=1 Tax=Scleropages formosus TaxID=113540 RepID=A0A8C9SNY5_SCLFO
MRSSAQPGHSAGKSVALKLRWSSLGWNGTGREGKETPGLSNDGCLTDYCWEPVPRGRLEKLDEMDVVDAMVEAYTVEGALEITLHILRRMDLNELAFRLWRDALCQNIV